MTKDDKHLRDTILAELRRRRDLQGQDPTSARSGARDGGKDARAERTGPAGEPRIVTRSTSS